MIRHCKRGKVDMIITKSISRFARNTVDCLIYTRKLRELGIDVYFEEQRLHSMQAGSEFYITLYGSIAQSESENISENVKWGKAQAAKEGKVAFSYKHFLGYKKGADGQPEIDEEEAPTIRYIYERFLAGDSIQGIANKLMEKGLKTPCGKEEWGASTIRSILKNERYTGDVIINKTFIVDCLTKKAKVNNGERAKYLVENNHPGIISREVFGAAQEELAKRVGKPKVSGKGISERGKYSSKFALTEILVCGECKTAYRRCTWVKRGKKKIVWRCVNRIDFGSRYCHESPTIGEDALHSAIMAAIQGLAQESGTALDTLKLHIGMVVNKAEGKDERAAIKIRLAEIQLEIRQMITATSSENVDSFDDSKIQILALEQAELKAKLEGMEKDQAEKEKNKSKLEDLYTILDGLKNHPLEYDDELVRKMIDTIVVLTKDKIRIVFKGGLEIDQMIE